jgi:hypothetical protein
MQRAESLMNGIFRAATQLSIVRGETLTARASCGRFKSARLTSAADLVAGTELPCTFRFFSFASTHRKVNTPRLPAIRKEIARISLHYLATLSLCPGNTICGRFIEGKHILEVSPSLRSVSIKLVLRKRAMDFSLCRSRLDRTKPNIFKNRECRLGPAHACFPTPSDQFRG